jgi:methionyl-tRNA synthetase
MAKFYITNAIPYVNARPHIGHALEFVQSDVIARYHRVLGDEVILLCGGDENALKNIQAAEKAGKPIQEFIDTNTEVFYDLSKKLHVQFDAWQKGSDTKHHYASSQKLWELCVKAGDIYKKSYKGLYCIGCETFYTQNELDDNGECCEHPGRKPEFIEEENYFFRLSKYQKQLIQLIETDTYKIIPTTRKNEILAFLKSGLQDFSISRSNARAKNWGVPVPGDPTQRIYVWFDALNIYQSGIGFGWDEKMYEKWWPADVHIIGKGIIRFHAVYWPAILLSAKLSLPKSLFVHEYFTVNGQKMSKTLGNVIDPFELIEKYGAEALRYYFLAKFSPFSDGDFSEKKFIEVFNGDLANGLGNLVARVAKLCESIDYSQMGSANRTNEHVIEDGEYTKDLQEFKLNEAIGSIWKKIAGLDQYINQEKPWMLIKTNSQKMQTILTHCVDQIQEIGVLLKPFMPETSDKILEQFKGPKIKSDKPLFPRIQ